MARTIVVNLGGETSTFGIERVSRDKLYGKRVKVVVDETGAATQAASLMRDGSALLPKGTIASLYVDDEFEVASRTELQAVDSAGNPLDPVDSTLGVEQPLRGPIDPRRVLDHVATAVYALDEEQLGEKLRAGLVSGGIYEVDFNYRAGFESRPAFLMHNDEGYFAIVGELAEFDYLRRETLPVEDDGDDEDPFDDDLDFSMF